MITANDAHIKGERIPVHDTAKSYSSFTITASRAAGSSVGRMATHGRSKAEDRQAIADGFALVTETARLVLVRGHGAYAHYEMQFVTTHRIVPVELFGADS